MESSLAQPAWLLAALRTMDTIVLLPLRLLRPSALSNLAHPACRFLTTFAVMVPGASAQSRTAASLSFTCLLLGQYCLVNFIPIVSIVPIAIWDQHCPLVVFGNDALFTLRCPVSCDVLCDRLLLYIIALSATSSTHTGTIPSFHTQIHTNDTDHEPISRPR